jgi:hypothetical protein
LDDWSRVVGRLESRRRRDQAESKDRLTAALRRRRDPDLRVLPATGARERLHPEDGAVAATVVARRSPPWLAWELLACPADGLRHRRQPLMQSANRPVEGERAARDEEERQQRDVPGPQYVEERQGVHKMITAGVSVVFHPSARVANVMSNATGGVSKSRPPGLGTINPEAPFVGRLTPATAQTWNGENEWFMSSALSCLASLALAPCYSRWIGRSRRTSPTRRNSRPRGNISTLRTSPGRG